MYTKINKLESFRIIDKDGKLVIYDRNIDKRFFATFNDTCVETFCAAIGAQLVSFVGRKKSETE